MRSPLFTLGGRFRYWHFDRRGRLKSSGVFKNGIADAAMNDVLEVYFRSGTQRTAWYGGLVDLSGFSAFSHADTMSSHAGWTEVTSYTASTRPQWSPGAASGGEIVNGTLMAVTASANFTAHGLFIASDNTKGGTSGLLWATGAFDADQAMAAGEVLKFDYDLVAAAGAGS